MLLLLGLELGQCILLHLEDQLLHLELEEGLYMRLLEEPPLHLGDLCMLHLEDQLLLPVVLGDLYMVHKGVV